MVVGIWRRKLRWTWRNSTNILCSQVYLILGIREHRSTQGGECYRGHFRDGLNGSQIVTLWSSNCSVWILIWIWSNRLFCLWIWELRSACEWPGRRCPDLTGRIYITCSGQLEFDTDLPKPTHFKGLILWLNCSPMPSRLEGLNLVSCRLEYRQASSGSNLPQPMFRHIRFLNHPDQSIHFPSFYSGSVVVVNGRTCSYASY